MKDKWVGVVWLLSLSGCALTANGAEDAARVVVAAVRDEATRNARLRPATRRNGDALTDLYVRCAAAAARQLPAEQAIAGFLIGLGIALDDSTILRNNPVTALLCRRAESDEERRWRLAVLGSPTMRGRRDLCQHFVVSCALTEVIGARLAEAAGLYKEQQDSRGGSGFSFIDMMADLSGIDLALRLKKGDLSLEVLELAFLTDRFLPDIDGLKEGFQAKDFEKEFGSVADRRFVEEMQRLRERIGNLPRLTLEQPPVSRCRFRPGDLNR